MSYVHRCMIVPAAQAPLARELVVTLAGAPAANMFTTGLSATGDIPFTHYVSTGMIEEQFAAVLADPALMAMLCNSVGRAITEPECTALLTACDVSTEEPHVALARIGLKMLFVEQLQELQAQRDAAAAQEAQHGAT
ncbi:hypothetical protein [Variovorax sp. AFSI2.2]|uniref:hypothetical protein n=1 Tax=Variovorax sp. AFSI2.2 TaxID=3384160 RepID=UPI003EC0F6D6